MKASRKPPTPGDVFAMQIPAGHYLFGRVMLAGVAWPQAPTPGAHLLYIYRIQLRSAEVEASSLTRRDLLIPPVWTNSQGWTRGLFVTLGNTPLHDSDWLEAHAFRDVVKGIVNIEGKATESAAELIGEWGLVSYRWIDDRISEALGIPLVSLDAE